MEHLTTILVILAVSYLCGSIPFGLILIKVFKKTDIRTLGSGNIGATNAVRAGGKLIGFFTLVFDSLKGVLAILLTQEMLIHELDTEFYQIALSLSAFAAVIGHVFPVWLHFKGGKGVATSVAVILYLAPLLGFLGIAVWIMIFFTIHVSSLSSLIMMAILTFAAIFAYNYYISILVLLLSILIFINHASNIKRIIEGKEFKL